jgi:hypothetical protein
MFYYLFINTKFIINFFIVYMIYIKNFNYYNIFYIYILLFYQCYLLAHNNFIENLFKIFNIRNLNFFGI